MKEIVTDSCSFEDLITAGDIIYVDKTAYVQKMVKSRSRFFFISRPRRFGKSLMCSTLDALFSGKKGLFKDLYIGKTDYDFRTYPVLRFDFSAMESTSYENFLSAFRLQLKDVAAKQGMTLQESSPAIMLTCLLMALDSPVIIIDEFDSPMIDAVAEGEQELAERMRRDFNAFYKVIKSYTGKIRFLFMTGCTKLSGLSIFSAMNNLKDISAEPEYAGMFGYTEEELLKCFSEHMEQKLGEGRYDSREAFLEALRTYYDGYRFSPYNELRVFNPVSIGSYFAGRVASFRNFWAGTGGLSTLSVMLAKSVNLLSIANERCRLAIEDLTLFDISQIASKEVSDASVEALLYYAGYLTIKGSYKTNIILDFPNTEVRTTFLSTLVQAYSRKRENPQAIVTDAVCAAESGDHGTLVSLLNRYFQIPSYEDLMWPDGKKEQLFRLIFKLFFGMLGLTVYTELPGGMGRIDAVMITETDNYVFEFKVDGKSPDEAIEIIKRHYAWFFTTSPKPLHLIGLDFRTEERQIVSYTHRLYGRDEEEIRTLQA